MNVIKKQFYFLTIVFLLVSGIVSPFSNVVTANEAPSSNSTEGNQYEIYPLPQNQIYLGTNFTVTDVVNIVIEPTIDESTRNFLNKILESKSIGATISEEVVSDKTNILIGTKNSKGYVENYVNKNIEYDSAIFNELDAYVLHMDKGLEEKGTIAILGSSRDAAYYSLATLKMIFDQIPGKDLKSVKIEDFADAKWRGLLKVFMVFHGHMKIG